MQSRSQSVSLYYRALFGKNLASGWSRVEFSEKEATDVYTGRVTRTYIAGQLGNNYCCRPPLTTSPYTARAITGCSGLRDTAASPPAGGWGVTRPSVGRC